MATSVVASRWCFSAGGTGTVDRPGRSRSRGSRSGWPWRL